MEATKPAFVPACLLVSLLLLSHSLFSSILTSHPSAGQRLDILDEGAGNASVLLIAPDGSRQNLALRDGQLSVVADQPGRWVVRIGAEQAAVDVSLAPETARTSSEFSSPLPAPLLVLAASFILVLLSLAAAAAWSLAFPPAPRRSPALCRRFHDGEVRVELQAGTVPLVSVRLEDDGAPGRPLQMSARRLAAGERLQMRYPAEKISGAARASFTLDGQAHAWRLVQGEERGSASPAPGRAPGPPPDAPESRPPPARKLSRGS